MSRGRRYSDEGQLNYVKVFAVIIAIVVIGMGIAIVKNLLSRGKEASNNEVSAVSYYALYADKKWGIVDSTGKTVIEPSYQEMLIVLNNKKDVFLCTYDVDEKTGDYKTKVINKENKEIYTDYEKVEPLSNYNSSENVWYEEDVFKFQKDGKYGLLSIDGKEILSPEYDEIETLKGLKNSILVKKDGNFGLVNTSGATIINPEFTKIEKFDDDYKHGYITVDKNKKYGLVSYAGTKILDNKYEKILKIYGENYFAIEEKGKQIVLDSNGEKVLEGGYDKITQINSDGIVYQKDKNYGFMDYDGKIKMNAEYKALKEINTGLLKAKKDDKFGIIDLNGKVKVKYNYKDIYYDENAGFYVAEKDEYNSDILDTSFKVQLSGILSELNTEKGYMKLKVKDEDKYYNFKFEEKDIKDILSSNTLFVSKKGNKYGFVDKDGNVIVDYIYDEAEEQNAYGFAAVKKGKVWGAVDSKGEITIEPKYNLDNYLVIDFIGKWHLGQDLNMNYYCEK